jgi:hypothetical protein
MKYEIPGTPGSVVSFRSRYENFIGGQWTAVGVSPLRRPFAQFVQSAPPLPSPPERGLPGP